MTSEHTDGPELRVRLIRPDETAWYNALMAEHHSLGAAASGRVLRYVAEAGGVPLVLGTFGSAAWRLPARDAHVGWSDEQRAERLERLCCNQRLCVLPAAAGTAQAASRSLAAMIRVLPADYLAAFGVRLAAAESFTDPSTHAGTVYKASGFSAAGHTAGYSRSRGTSHYVRNGQPKTYWIRELAPGALKALKAGFDTRPLTGRTTPDFNELRMGAGAGSLLSYLAGVGDHRKANGIRHDLAAILVVVVVARLSGANSVHACGQFASKMPQEALRRCGIRCNERLRRYVPPSPKTIKRAVRAADAQAADEQMCAWLRAENAAGRLKWRHIAIDGKSVRGAIQPDGTRPHLLSAYDVTTGTVLGQDSIHAKTNEITCFVPLINAILDSPRAAAAAGDGDGDGREGGGSGPEGAAEAEDQVIVVTADAMHTQTGHVTAMNAAGIKWMLNFKDNQPGMYALADAHPWEDEPVLHATSEVSHGRHEIRTIRVTTLIPDGITARFPGTVQLTLTERYRHTARGKANAAACRAAGEHDPITCAAACGAKLSCETVLTITALTPAQASPATLLRTDRKHWAIENGLHHRRDTTFAEDASRLRAGSGWRFFAAAANTTVSVLNRAGLTNHAAARRDFGWDHTGLDALPLLGL